MNRIFEALCEATDNAPFMSAGEMLDYWVGYDDADDDDLDPIDTF